MNGFSSRWIGEFTRLLLRRKHVLLHGNIHDHFLWRGQDLALPEFLRACFREMGFNLILHYDPLDGFTFAGSELPPPPPIGADGIPLPPWPGALAERYAEVIRRQVAQRRGDHAVVIPATPGLPPVAGSSVAAVASPRALPGAAAGIARPRRLPPEEALAELRLALGQHDLPLAAILDLGDMLTATTTHFAPEERHALMLLKKCTLEAAVLRGGALQGYVNPLVIQASDLRRVPEWFHRDNPHIALLQVGGPEKEERRLFALHHLRTGGNQRGFFSDAAIDDTPPAPGCPSELEQLAEEFADLTAGLSTIDLHALRFSSWQNRIPLRRRQVARLVDHFKLGVRADPWEALGADRIAQAEAILTQRVIGQPRAVTMVTDLLTTARVGLKISGGGGSSQPKGLFFFVGPTGVGKTELAKAMTELVFGDERAFARFDMSEYKEEHAAEKLAGAPPGFVGYEEGGQLTNRIIAHPHTIVLFDEIEKAHPRVLDKFLQILEDGRLTDGRGRTAHFQQSALIFTSNIGASDLSDPQSGQMIRPGIMQRVHDAGGMEAFPYVRVEEHFRREVAWYFTSRIGRAELLNRLGESIVVFDLLRPEHVERIGRKFMDHLIRAAREKYRLTLEIDPTVGAALQAEMARGDNRLFGGRRIKSLLEVMLERPLNRALFALMRGDNPLAGASMRVGIDARGELRVQRVHSNLHS
ncbi:MAG: AAA family ATPase [Magnetococcales bacterium]|nr:AAA family ATPase [Magnetococcales bacterium]